MGGLGSGKRARPTALKVLEGGKGKPNEPVPAPAEYIDPPTDLPPDALAEWNRVTPELYELGYVSEIDRAALTAYCMAYALYIGAQRAIAAEQKRDTKRRGKKKTGSGGLLVLTQYGNLIQNPAVGVLNKAGAAMVKYASEFGMTPAARSRINVKKARTKDPTDEFFG